MGLVYRRQRIECEVLPHSLALLPLPGHNNAFGVRISALGGSVESGRTNDPNRTDSGMVGSLSVGLLGQFKVVGKKKKRRKGEKGEGERGRTLANGKKEI